LEIAGFDHSDWYRFRGADQITDVYFSMLNAGNSIWGSQLGFLP